MSNGCKFVICISVEGGGGINWTIVLNICEGMFFMLSYEHKYPV